MFLRLDQLPESPLRLGHNRDGKEHLIPNEDLITTEWSIGPSDRNDASVPLAFPRMNPVRQSGCAWKLPSRWTERSKTLNPAVF